MFSPHYAVLTPFEGAPGTANAGSVAPAATPGANDIVAEIGATTPPDGISVIPPPGAGRSEY